MIPIFITPEDAGASFPEKLIPRPPNKQNRRTTDVPKRGVCFRRNGLESERVRDSVKLEVWSLEPLIIFQEKNLFAFLP